MAPIKFTTTTKRKIFLKSSIPIASKNYKSKTTSKSRASDKKSSSQARVQFFTGKTPAQIEQEQKDKQAIELQRIKDIDKKLKLETLTKKKEFVDKLGLTMAQKRQIERNRYASSVIENNFLKSIKNLPILKKEQKKREFYLGQSVSETGERKDILGTTHKQRLKIKDANKQKVESLNIKTITKPEIENIGELIRTRQSTTPEQQKLFLEYQLEQGKINNFDALKVKNISKGLFIISTQAVAGGLKYLVEKPTAATINYIIKLYTKVDTPEEREAIKRDLTNKYNFVKKELISLKTISKIYTKAGGQIQYYLLML